MKKTLILFTGLAFLLSACNTMEGMGTDVEHGGQDLHNAAHGAKQNMNDNDTDNNYDNGNY